MAATGQVLDIGCTLQRMVVTVLAPLARVLGYRMPVAPAGS